MKDKGFRQREEKRKRVCMRKRGRYIYIYIYIHVYMQREKETKLESALRYRSGKKLATHKITGRKKKPFAFMIQ